ncbi:MULTISPECIES: glyoxalase [unclassified Streptomyces]|uniref:glyoxalase n=1 Tax=unclassified Streptomyces TaxID=2593676 RepID=UPI001F04E37D|nr:MULTISPECIES: glyoxalase [unclassified Streptomyces]MCH0564165.1 glyoxalase [Streptomyces sp. MUM 2J]MCH0568468.1 glyoxalase [Streptomyces sp. MUM 136J]
MTHLASITLGVADAEAAQHFYTTAFGLGPGSPVRLRTVEEPTSGFRGFTLALTVSRPSDVDALVDASLATGAVPLKPATRSLWGYGGVVRAPDGAIWKIATASKKDTGPATGTIDEIVLLLGVEDVKASKQFYVGRGLAVAKSFGGKYVEFAAGATAAAAPVKLALYKRRSLAKDLGVAAEGTGSHRIVLGGSAGSFTDPDGFAWEAAALAPSSS